MPGDPLGAEIAKAELLVYQYGRLKERAATGAAGGGSRDAGLTPWQISVAKRNNVAMALETARSARAVLGASGITTEHPVIRHMVNLETVYTYEGTHEMHTLIVGRALTGEDGF